MKTVKRKLSAEEIRRNEQAAEEERQLELVGALQKAADLTAKIFGKSAPDPLLVFEVHSSMMSTVEDGEFAEDEFLADMAKANEIAKSVFGDKATPLVVVDVFDRVFLEADDDFDEDEDEEDDE